MTVEKKKKVFISYRRADSPDFVEHIRSWFIIRYGRENVFMDFDSIKPFEKFTDTIKEKITECDVVVVIIGPQWTKLLREKAARFQDDYVKLEVELALSLDKILAPICIKGAQLPQRQNLPPELSPILDYQFAELNSGTHILDNINKVLDEIDNQFNNKTQVPTTKKNQESDISELFRVAERKYKEKDMKGAVEAYTKIIELDSQNLRAYFNRGLVYQIMGQLDQSIDDYSASLKIRKSHKVFNQRGLGYLSLAKTDEAITDFNAALNISINAPYLVNRGRAFVQGKRLDDAIHDFNHALTIDPESHEAVYERGRAYLLQEEYKLACDDLAAASEYIKRSQLTIHLAVAYYSCGKVQKSFELWRRFVQKSKVFLDSEQLAKEMQWPSNIATQVEKLIKELAST